MEKIGQNLYRFQDEAQCTSYLVVGQNKAYMIDCGMGTNPVMPMIREVTDLPVELLLTHAHPDHYGAAEEFDVIWLHERDLAALDAMEPVFRVMNVPSLPREHVRTFTDGHRFDLGNGTLLAVELKGHTPGSAVFVDEGNQVIFSGDAIGSGDIVLMAVPCAYSIADYRQSLEAFYARSEPWDAYVWLAGHYRQADRPGKPGANLPCRAMVADMIRLCLAIETGEITGEVREEPFAPQGRALCARLGTAGVVYTVGQLKTIDNRTDEC